MEKKTDLPLKLLPHQASLVDTFFNSAGKRVCLLRSDVGLGTTTALIAILCRLRNERPEARALCLVPASVQFKYVEMLRHAGAPSLLVDRYRFREMLDSTITGEIWPRGVMAVLSQNFANQPDVLDKLVGTRWDVVVADEAHVIGEDRTKTLQRIVASTERIILATGTALDFELPEGVLADDPAVVEWRRDSIIGHDGSPLFTLPRPSLHEVSFKLSPAELSLYDTVGSLCKILQSGTPGKRRIASSVRRSLISSPAAIELALQRLVERMRDGMYDNVPEDNLAGPMNHPLDEREVRIARTGLREIEAIGTDSKLNALDDLLAGLTDREKSCARVCVLTEHSSTLYYIAAEIEGRGIRCQILRGQDSGKQFNSRDDQQILVTVRARNIEGANLNNVTDVVFYDATADERELRQILGRFDRFGRTNQLSIHVLRPSNGNDQFRYGPDRLLVILRSLVEPANAANEKQQRLPF